MMDMVQEIERKMTETSALNRLFLTHVLRQSHQIELIYTWVLLFPPDCKGGYWDCY